MVDYYYYNKNKKLNTNMGSYTVDSSGSDCKSDVERLAWFDSKTAH